MRRRIGRVGINETAGPRVNFRGRYRTNISIGVTSDVKIIPPTLRIHQLQLLIKQYALAFQQPQLLRLVDTRRCILSLAFEASNRLLLLVSIDLSRNGITKVGQLTPSAQIIRWQGTPGAYGFRRQAPPTARGEDESALDRAA